MAQPTSSTLWSIVLVRLADRIRRSGLALLQIHEQRVDHVVELLLGEIVSNELAERDRRSRRVVAVVAVARGQASTVGGVNGERGLRLLVKGDGGRGRWIGDEGTLLFRLFTAFGRPQRREPADDMRDGRRNLATRLGGRRLRKREEGVDGGLRGHGGVRTDVVSNQQVGGAISACDQVI